MTYTPPTADEVRLLLTALALTGDEAAALLALSSGRTVRHYTSGARAMDFGKLYTLTHRRRGIRIGPDTWRATLAPLLLDARYQQEKAEARKPGRSSADERS